MSGTAIGALLSSRRYARACALLVCLLGILVLFGWATDNRMLQTAMSGLVSMKPNAAICFVLCGLGLGCGVQASHVTTRRCLGFAAAAIGAATLAEYIGHWDFGIDELLFAEPAGAYASLFKTRMHPTTAFAFTISGIGIALINYRLGRNWWLAQGVAAGVLALSFGTFLCYLFGIKEFYGISRYGQMALHTTIGFILLSSGLLATQPTAGFMPLILALNRDGRLTRSMLAAALLIPFSVGFITLLCVRAGWFGNEFGLALQIIITAACFSVFVLFVARVLETARHLRQQMTTHLQVAHQELERRVEERTIELALTNQRLQHEISDRQQSAEALRQSEERMRSMVDSANAGIVTADGFGTIRSWNRGAELIFGYTEEEIVGQSLTVLIPMPLRASQAAGLQRFVQTGQTRLIGTTVEVKGLHKEGREIPVELSLATWKSGGEDFFSGILVDISRRKQAEADLVAAKDMAEAGARAKGDFLATMSHEIRTPMNGVLGMLGFILDTPLAEEQRSFAETAKSSAESLLVVINDILDFSKIEAGKLAIECIHFDMQTAIEEVIDILADRVESKGLELIMHLPHGVSTGLNGDAGRVRQILLNLLGNAVKFTEQGTITVSVSHAPPSAGTAGGLRVTVKDSGIGIAPDQQGGLFQKFTQADVSTTRRYGGTGLGLAICRRLVELMGGTIGFDSAPGSGSRFWFILPLPDEADLPIAVRPMPAVTVAWLDGATVSREWAAGWFAERGITCEVGDSPSAFISSAAAILPEIIFIDAGIGTVEELVAFRRAQPLTVRIALICRIAHRSLFRDWRKLGFCGLLFRPLRPSQMLALMQGGGQQVDPLSSPTSFHVTPQLRGRVLLAEDNLVNQQVARRLLERLGLRVDVVGNGIEAVDLATRLPYDLVFMDCQMPEMDGFAATKALRRSPTTRHLRIIALTANALSDDRQRCLDAGMDDYLSKPIRLVDLQVLIDRWLSVSRTGEEA